MSTSEDTRFLAPAGTCSTCGDTLVAEGENGTLTHASEENCPTQFDDHGAGCDGPFNCTCEAPRVLPASDTLGLVGLALTTVAGAAEIHHGFDGSEQLDVTWTAYPSHSPARAWWIAGTLVTVMSAGSLFEAAR